MFPGPYLVPSSNPSLNAKVPTGAGWLLYEIKLDGDRCQLCINAGAAKACSRGALDFRRDFAPMIEAADEFPARRDHARTEPAARVRRPARVIRVPRLWWAERGENLRRAASCRERTNGHYAIQRLSG